MKLTCEACSRSMKESDTVSTPSGRVFCVAGKGCREDLVRRIVEASETWCFKCGGDTQTGERQFVNNGENIQHRQGVGCMVGPPQQPIPSKTQNPKRRRQKGTPLQNLIGGGVSNLFVA